MALIQISFIKWSIIINNETNFHVCLLELDVFSIPILLKYYYLIMFTYTYRAYLVGLP